MKTLFNILFLLAIIWMILMFGMFFTGTIEKPCQKSSTQMIILEGKKVDALICENTNPPIILKVYEAPTN